MWQANNRKRAARPVQFTAVTADAVVKEFAIRINQM